MPDKIKMKIDINDKVNNSHEVENIVVCCSEL